MDDSKFQENYGLHIPQLEKILTVTSAPGLINWKGLWGKLYQDRDIKNLTT